ncbi:MULTISPECIES: hypothetical protein [Streptomyces]|uniref:hypothetical protein n=1 Tax=Streptomyces TaxID=1883 RepID=UPI001D13B244|nr:MULTISPECIES: hypothetical protein [Streptomyces]MCC3655617.1 hypothetical protein [Streptomyces sp. S07_1.15]WSQ70070.1 hypothetical protein OG463_00610 [Streptomyces xinghaiensis]
MRSTAGHRRARKTVPLFLALTLGAVPLTGCGEDSGEAGPEASVRVEEPRGDGGGYEFEYGDLEKGEFWNDVETWTGKRVTVTSRVHDVVDSHFFTIAGTRGDNPQDLPVLSGPSVKEGRIEDGDTVRVTGTVQEAFDTAEAEKEVGLDLEDELFTDWQDEHYIVATRVDTSVSLD